MSSKDKGRPGGNGPTSESEHRQSDSNAPDVSPAWGRNTQPLLAAAMHSAPSSVLALGLEPADLPGNRAIWQAILDLCHDGEEPDAFAVAARLEIDGTADEELHAVITLCGVMPVDSAQLRAYAVKALEVRQYDAYATLAHSITGPPAVWTSLTEDTTELPDTHHSPPRPLRELRLIVAHMVGVIAALAARCEALRGDGNDAH